MHHALKFSDSEESVRVVKSAKTRAFEAFETYVTQLRNAMKILDHTKLKDEFDSLTKAMTKSAKVFESQGGIPRFLVRILCDVEDFVHKCLADKASFKKLKPASGRALNQMKLKVKKFSEPYRPIMEEYRKNPQVSESEDSSSSESEDEKDSDDDSSSSSSSSGSSSSSSSGGEKKKAAPKKKKKKAESDSDDSDSDSVSVSCCVQLVDTVIHLYMYIYIYMHWERHCIYYSKTQTTATVITFHPLFGVCWISSFPILSGRTVHYDATDKVVLDFVLLVR